MSSVILSLSSDIAFLVVNRAFMMTVHLEIIFTNFNEVNVIMEYFFSDKSRYLAFFSFISFD